MRWITLALLASSSCFGAGELAPEVRTVTPKVVKPGDTVVVTGISLGQDRIEEVYLTDNKFDMKCKVLEQSPSTIKFRIPPFSKPGRMQLLMLAKPDKADADPKLLELPDYLLIEEAPTEISQSQPQDKAKKTAQGQQK